MTFRPRKVDQQAIRESSIRKTIEGIEAERRRRQTRCNLELGADIPRPDRQLGRTDITDIPSDVPWQKIALDQLGVAYPVNKNWTCPRCGQVRLGSFPSARCTRCGLESPISKLNLRR